MQYPMIEHSMHNKNTCFIHSGLFTVLSNVIKIVYMLYNTILFNYLIYFNPTTSLLTATMIV